ncbi:hypothetical protein scyTo_0018086, partial [Scyliorhinus torazame]|nr:hypothetical protein [Scyliorhinus torazame]
FSAFLLLVLSNGEETAEDVLDAGSLMEVLRMYKWQMSSFEEQDAHELFHILTAALEDERDRQPRVAHLFDVRSLEAPPDSEEKQLSCRSRGPLLPPPGPWRSQHPFHGRLTSNMVCKRCEQQSPVRYDTFDSLSLSIPTVTWGRPVTLDLCLQHFISSESIKDVVCENCTKEGETLNGQTAENQRTTFIKQLKIGKLPQCLCIHLQRLSWSNCGTPLKRNEHVQFSELLSLDTYKYRSPSQRPGHRRMSRPASTGSLPRMLEETKTVPVHFYNYIFVYTVGYEYRGRCAQWAEGQLQRAENPRKSQDKAPYQCRNRFLNRKETRFLFEFPNATFID